MTGRIMHFEIPFDDGTRARTFYQQAFGWKLDEMPEMNYTSAATGPIGESGMPNEPGYINGGMFQRSDDTPTGPVLTVDVPDIDAALQSIEKLGGSTMTPRTPPGTWGSSPTSPTPRATSSGCGRQPPDRAMTSPAPRSRCRRPSDV